ncbi:hypothetical protein [Halomarina rubra]|uniref:Holin n=1 Tax=Halomarina rubra TaxID=2071873 RepID=A0ABD6AXB4_9EURY|nr:hypothetical protein [Halomarina rubra]
MSNETPGSERRLLAHIPWWVKLAGAMVTLVYAVGVLTDTITPLPNDVTTVIWVAVTIGLFVRAVRLHVLNGPS